MRVHTDISRYVSRLVAFDVDEAVLENEETEERYHASPGQPLPFEDRTFDLVYSTWTLEHIVDAKFYAGEIARVLKAGGWFCALTPNRWGQIALAASLVPERMHAPVLRRLVPHRKEKDTFATVYRMNTRTAIAHLFPGWLNGTFYFSGPVGYHAGLMTLARLWQVLDWLTPRVMSRLVMVFVQKPPESVLDMPTAALLPSASEPSPSQIDA